MKKIIFALTATYTLLCTTSLFVNAQESLLASNQKSYTTNNFENSSGKKVTAEEINVKAVRDFEKSVKHAQQVNWYKNPDGFAVYYYQNDTKNISGYDSKGNWLYNLVSYKEDKLPRQIWHQVKSVYYEYAIIWANEIQLANQTLFIVHLEDKNSYKNIRIADDEMEVIEEIKK